MVLSWLLKSCLYFSRDDWGTAHSASGGALGTEVGGGRDEQEGQIAYGGSSNTQNFSRKLALSFYSLLNDNF